MRKLIIRIVAVLLVSCLTRSALAQQSTTFEHRDSPHGSIGSFLEQAIPAGLVIGWEKAVAQGITPNAAYKEIFDDLMVALVDSPHGGKLLLPDLHIKYTRVRGQPRQETPVPIDALIVLKGLAIYLIDRSFERGFSFSDLEHLGRWIEVYNASPEVRITLDVPALFVTSLSNFFKDSQAYIKFSKQLRELPEPHRSWALALDLFLNGTHRHAADDDLLDDFEVYPGMLDSVYEEFKKSESDEVMPRVHAALLTGLGRFIAFMGPFTEWGYSTLEYEVERLNHERVDQLKLILRQMPPRIFALLQLPLRRAEHSLPRSDLFTRDHYLLGLSILFYAQAEEHMTRGLGKAPVTLTRLLLLRDNPEANRYVEKMLRKADPKYYADYDEGVARQRHFDLTWFFSRIASTVALRGRA